MSSHPITIIGAGLAGLTLGRCLRQRGVPTVILEKSKVPSQSQYAITLHPWAYRPLLRLLDVDEVIFQTRVSVDASRTRAKGPPGSMRCHRGKLERFLREGQAIRWDHKVEDIELSTDGIAIKCANAETSLANMVIATDGVHSTVRRLLMPDVALKVLPYVIFYGKRVIDLTEYQTSIEAYMQGKTVIQSQHDDTHLQISIIEYGDENVHLSHTYSRLARAEDPLHRPDRSTGEANQVPEAFYHEIDRLHDLGNAFAHVFNSQKMRTDRILHWLMRSSLGSLTEIEDLTERGVLLIGDVGLRLSESTLPVDSCLKTRVPGFGTKQKKAIETYADSKCDIGNSCYADSRR